jgi:hypothetical protein
MPEMPETGPMGTITRDQAEYLRDLLFQLRETRYSTLTVDFCLEDGKRSGDVYLDGYLQREIPPFKLTGILDESWHCKVTDMYYVTFYVDKQGGPTMRRSSELPLPLDGANDELKRLLPKFPRAEIVSCRDVCRGCLYRGP